jgi:hypothetical protein
MSEHVRHGNPSLEHSIQKASRDVADFNRILRIASVLGFLLAAGAYFEPIAWGQGAVAYQPVIGFVPNGVAVEVTPAISADRRYVRLGVNPYFITANGFTTYQSQLAAVGGTGFAGMNGAIGGVGAGMGSGASFGRPETGTYTAGDYPPASAGLSQGFPRAGLSASRDAFDEAIMAPRPAINEGLDADRAAAPGFAQAPRSPSIRTAPRSKSARRTAARKPNRSASKPRLPLR